MLLLCLALAALTVLAVGAMPAEPDDAVITVPATYAPPAASAGPR
jgi:molecular chaperone DnaK (HSP70)